LRCVEKQQQRHQEELGENAPSVQQSST
jgi:hypothetical protein